MPRLCGVTDAKQLDESSDPQIRQAILQTPGGKSPGDVLGRSRSAFLGVRSVECVVSAGDSQSLALQKGRVPFSLVQWEHHTLQCTCGKIMMDRGEAGALPGALRQGISMRSGKPGPVL